LAACRHDPDCRVRCNGHGNSGSASQWSKRLTIILGAAVTVVTVGANTFFPADYRSIRRAVVEMKQAHYTLRDLRESILQTADPHIRNSETSAFHKQFAIFNGIESKLLSGQSVNLIPVVHAQTASGPAWVAAPPASSKDTLYFVGSASGPTYTQAREAAIAQATRLGAVQVNSSKALAPGIAEYLQHYATVADTYYVRDAQTRTYNFHVLLRASADITLLDTAQFVRTGKSLRLKKLLVLQDGDNGPTEWAFDIFVDNAKAASIAPRKYDNKNESSPVLDWPLVTVPLDKPANIEIRGYRPGAPSIKTSGSITIQPNGEIKVVPVRNLIPLRGSFDFTVYAYP